MHKFAVLLLNEEGNPRRVYATVEGADYNRTFRQAIETGHDAFRNYPGAVAIYTMSPKAIKQRVMLLGKARLQLRGPELSPLDMMEVE